ncbi:MAG: hypothetical protein VB065_14050 [Eubacteriales bacterium]|nr:hypothetical protein [Christensenellaceae bacterium]MEA5067158.1 hypothetical protein [Eubacteriales bacterium]
MIPFAGATVTLYNRREGKDANGRTVVTWHRTVQHNCFWTRRTVRAIENGNVKIGEVLVCKIPESPAYLPPDEWATLTDPTGRFTLWAGDIIVLGDVPDEIGPSLTESALRMKYARRGLMVVTSAKDRCISGAGLRHYLAEGV